MSRLMFTCCWSLCLLILLVTTLAGRSPSAEIPPLSKERLESESDLIVSGTVAEIKAGKTKDDGRGIRETPYRLVVEVGQVTKGKAPEGKNVVTATGSNFILPQGMVGTSGIRSDNTHDLLSGVRQDWEVRLYLKASKNGDYEIVSPNGFAVIKKPASKRDK